MPRSIPASGAGVFRGSTAANGDDDVRFTESCRVDPAVIVTCCSVGEYPSFVTDMEWFPGIIPVTVDGDMPAYIPSILMFAPDGSVVIASSPVSIGRVALTTVIPPVTSDAEVVYGAYPNLETVMVWVPAGRLSPENGVFPRYWPSTETEESEGSELT
jgi:hypothetical protein